MNVHKLLHNVVPFVNDSVNRIAFGGCGLFAMLLHNVLASKGIESHIVLVRGGCYDEASVTRFIDKTGGDCINSAILAAHNSNKHHYQLPNHHICVSVGDILYDNNGRQDDDRAISDGIEPDMMEHALTWNVWNSSFNDSNKGVDTRATINEQLLFALKGATA